MPETTRRDAIQSICAACLGLTGGAAIGAMGYSLLPPPPVPGQGRVRVPLAEISAAEGKKILYGGRPVLLLRAGDEVRAFSAICTHSGCVVNWKGEKGEIVCPCHNGRFTDRGQVLGGPVKAPLAAVPVKRLGDTVEVGE